MNGVNLQILIGNLGRNAEIRTIDGNRSKATFSIATNRSYQNREGQNIVNTYWHNVVVWDPKLVEMAQQHCTIGKQVLVEGESTTRSYEDRNGNTQYMREVKATRVVPIEQIEQEGSMYRSFIVGRLLEKPVLDTNEAGEPRCTLVFKVKETTLPIELTGRKAEVAAKYLEAQSLAHLNYEIVSTNPFKAVGLDLTLLGQRPSSQEEDRTYPKSTTEEVKSGNAVDAHQSSNELDDLPF